MLRYTMIIGVAVALWTGSIRAADKEAPADKKPAATKVVKTVKTAPAKPAAKTSAPKLQITVVEVSGIAEKRSAGDPKAKWTAIKVGDVLGELTLIRTGLGGSKVVLKLADRGTITITTSAKIGIASFKRSGGLVKTDIGLKYGALRANVDSSRGANDFRLRTPVGTLAAKGTGGYFAFWGDFKFQAMGTDGTWLANMAHRVATIVAGEWTDEDLQQPIAVLLARYGLQLGDGYGGLTPSELKNLLLNGGGRGILGFIGNARGHGSPRLIKALHEINRSPAVEGGPLGGSDDPDRYKDDPERGRDR